MDADDEVVNAPCSRLIAPSGPREESTSTSQGRPRTVFARALQNGNLYVAEALARELGRISSVEAGARVTLLMEVTVEIEPPRVSEALEAMVSLSS
jgi:hypothetical protein